LPYREALDGVTDSFSENNFAFYFQPLFILLLFYLSFVTILLLGFTVTLYVFEDFLYIRRVRLRNIHIFGVGETPPPSVLSLRGGIQNILNWCRHLYSSCGSAKHR
jgi:hypothetical protein